MNEDAARKISVLIVDDHTIVRQGLRTLLELYDDIWVCGEAANGKAAVEMATRLRPTVILMDLVMPEMDGIQATRQVSALNQGARVLVLTSFVEDEKVIHAVQAGAFGYLLKDVAPDALIEAIRAAARGESRLHPDAAQKLMKQVAAQPAQPPAPAGGLTEREIEVLRLVAQGMSNRDIAQALVISEKTVKTHVSSLLETTHLFERVLARLMTPPARLHTWRTVQGQEVDFVLEHGRKALAIEVKLAGHPNYGGAVEYDHRVKRAPAAIPTRGSTRFTNNCYNDL